MGKLYRGVINPLEFVARRFAPVLEVAVMKGMSENRQRTWGRVPIGKFDVEAHPMAEYVSAVAKMAGKLGNGELAQEASENVEYAQKLLDGYRSSEKKSFRTHLQYAWAASVTAARVVVR